MILLAALVLLPTQLACDDGPRRPPAAIVIVSPGGGDVLAIDADVDIQWQIQAEIATVNIDISRDGGLTWDLLDPLATDLDAAASPYKWTVAGQVSGNCRLRISDAEDETRSAETGSFEIATAFLIVVSPNGYEKWGIACTRNIRWSQLGVANVKIELSRDGNWENDDGSDVETIADSLDAADRSYPWTVAAPADTNCKVRISDAAVGGTLWDESNEPFEIADPSLALSAPVGGIWQIQDTMNITWNAVGVDEIRIEIYRQNGFDIVDWTPLDTVSAYSGLYAWTVNPGDLGVSQDQSCKVRLVNTANPTLPPPAESAPFTIPWDDVYRVKASGDGTDGTTWETAFRHPQEAVVVAGSANDIWVAAGTYTDTAPFGTVLDLDPDTTIYGGFLGSEYAFPAQRTGVSKLDGQNSVRVVTGADDAIFDGFTVVRGNTFGDGGGMRNSSSNMIVANCVFGGAASAANTATGNGGAIYNSSTMTITDCSFSSNRARMGGGIHNVGTLTCVDCVFNGNTATTTTSGNGGGGVAGAGGTLTVTGCEFTSNTAYCGGGAACTGGVVTFDKCVFTSNEATATFSDIGGGGLSCVTGGTVSNCVFLKNSAYYGGGICADVWAVAATLLIVNCSIADNSATYGGGIYDFYSEQYLPIRNTIVWGNSNSGIDVSDLIWPPHIEYSCLQNSIGGTVGDGNKYEDPKFTNLGVGDLHLSFGSPCINTGTSTGAPDDDIDGNPRAVILGGDGLYDMGAYEF